jgi:hypothetical protein
MAMTTPFPVSQKADFQILLRSQPKEVHVLISISTIHIKIWSQVTIQYRMPLQAMQRNEMQLYNKLVCSSYCKI